MPNKPQGRGLRRPPQKQPDPDAVARFVEGESVLGVQDVQDVLNAQDTQNTLSDSIVSSIDNDSDVQDVLSNSDNTNAQDVLSAEITSDVPAISDGSDAAVKPPTNSSAVERADGRTLRRTTIYFTPEVHKQLKKASRLSDHDMSQIVNKILSKQLPIVIKEAIDRLVADG